MRLMNQYQENLNLEVSEVRKLNYHRWDLLLMTADLHLGMLKIITGNVKQDLTLKEKNPLSKI